MWWNVTWRVVLLGAGLGLLGACESTPKPVQQPTLNAPMGSEPAAIKAMEEGNQLFATGRWDLAKAQYEAAVKAQPTLAEAHYNLALTLDQLGDRHQAKPHYMEAANLAPGHQIIWNSPVLRRYGDVKVEKSTGTSTPVMPGLGGLGGGGGGIGGVPPGGY